MALILPPDTGYDSFVSVADATTTIEMYTLDAATWAALSASDKEIYLRISTRRIEDGIDEDVYTIDPTDIPICLPEATAFLAIHDVVNNISGGASETSATGAIKKEQVGSIVQEYYDTKSSSDSSQSVNTIPSVAYPCLESIGFVFVSGITGLKQTTLRRS